MDLDTILKFETTNWLFIVKIYEKVNKNFLKWKYLKKAKSLSDRLISKTLYGYNPAYSNKTRALCYPAIKINAVWE